MQVKGKDEARMPGISLALDPLSRPPVPCFERPHHRSLGVRLAAANRPLRASNKE